MEASAAAWASLNSGVVLSLIAVLCSMVWKNLEGLFFGRHFNRQARRLAAIVDPYLSVTVAEYDGGRMKQSDAYKEVQAYLQRASCDAGGGVRHLKAEPANGSDALVLSMGDNEEVADVFRGVNMLWMAYSEPPPENRGYWSRRQSQADRRFYRLFFLERDRDLVLGEYLPYVRREGRAVMVKNRQRKLFTNLSTEGMDDNGWWCTKLWSHVVFEHPKTFETLAMKPAKKKEIMDDLDAFRKGKEYYARVGKPWKRGYLLYGPPGTGKSTMIAAMANYLDYDIYDIELTSVRTNSDLRKIFIETTNKSIIVIEDIDCSLDLTGKRKKKKKAKDADAAKDGDKKDGDQEEENKEKEGSKVTLSGVLNFIDGLWSACGGERIIVFTTNHVDKLDPALIRRGRMDKHIEMSYCCFEAFKFLAKIYLGVGSHHLFDDVESLLAEVEITPADVSEYLTPKSDSDNADTCLADLVKELKRMKAEKAQAAQLRGKEVEAEAGDDEEE
ncbi:hypothetical protein GUJ93_ZPchr0007g4271 [Zizania palustris]|uniref:AAA+ ATPase domain-containing protein n=1 Tax=Zizania palustris TaxID=103762 RepID=A0A8J5SV84_ZIZPA|nr:hypothetical protein GUJ93_ZPchr0007g4271 [Zizania palustris]